MDEKPLSGPVFLSAGMPDPGRPQKYYATMDATAIREAVTGLVLAVTPTTSLVFGGQPAISPFVYQTAKAIGAIDNVVIYQSDFFRSRVPTDSLAFGRIKWTKPGTDQDTSLALMRQEMIRSHDFVAGVFIGGMEGIEDEFAMFKARHTQAIVLPIASTGAAARILFDRNEGPIDKTSRDLLESEYLYHWLFRRLLPTKP
jgi:hypothetical protein